MSVPFTHDLVISPRRRSPEEVLTSEVSSFIALTQAQCRRLSHSNDTADSQLGAADAQAGLVRFGCTVQRWRGWICSSCLPPLKKIGEMPRATWP
jgi:hypothetical protein